jgi:hypothetical protein
MSLFGLFFVIASVIGLAALARWVAALIRRQIRSARKRQENDWGLSSSNIQSSERKGMKPKHVIALAAAIAAVVIAFAWSKQAQQQVATSVTEPAQSTADTAEHLEFRGLRTGLTQKEVESVLRKLDENASLECDKLGRDGEVRCRSQNHPANPFKNLRLDFSGDGKLYSYSYDLGVNNLSELQQEVTIANHRQGTARTVMDFSGQQRIGTIIKWVTERTAVCFLNEEDDCPAEQIELELDGISQDIGPIHVMFNDMSVMTQGWVKKDKNRPHPKVAQEITFMNLRGGQTRDEVDTALRNFQYPPLTCEHDSKSIFIEETCSTRFQGHQFDLEFVHSQLSTFNFWFPPMEHDQLYQNLMKGLGQPTDSHGKTGEEELFSWESEQTVRCVADENRQCAMASLMLSPYDDYHGRVFYLYLPLFNMKIHEAAGASSTTVDSTPPNANESNHRENARGTCPPGETRLSSAYPCSNCPPGKTRLSETEPCYKPSITPKR